MEVQAEAGGRGGVVRKAFVLLVLAGLIAAIAAPTMGAAPSARQAKTVVISTRKLPKLGAVLVNSRGLTLYMFVPDKRAKVTCVGACAAVWPPVKLPKGAKPVAKGGAKASLLGSDPNPAGGRVVTYNKWPLYTYVADTKPGMAKGQALKLNGGLWYVLSPSGKVIRTKP
jgi:predicted lipoprotein with Yx(FWY)xxD motif